MEATVFVGVVIAVGELIGADRQPNTYLLLTIPLTAAFQLLICRRAITELWIRGSPPPGRRGLATGIAIALAVYPFVTLIQEIRDGGSLALVLYDVAAIGGAGAAGYCFSQLDRDGWRSLARCTVIVVAIGVAVKLIAGTAEAFAHPTAVHPHADVLTGITSLLLYVPALFLIEEVTFRGAVDSHVSGPDEPHGLVSAIYVSLLWSLWHAPIYGWKVAVAAGIVNMIPAGVVLSLYWRRSGNLAVSGTAHATNDAIRNAMLGGPPT